MTGMERILLEQFAMALYANSRSPVAGNFPWFYLTPVDRIYWRQQAKKMLAEPVP